MLHLFTTCNLEFACVHCSGVGGEGWGVGGGSRGRSEAVGAIGKVGLQKSQEEEAGRDGGSY